MLQFCEWLESTSLAAFVTQSSWGFSALVAAHLLGLTLSVGLIFWMDLRLVGFGLRAVPVAVLYRRIAPWMASGFVVMGLSGGALFVGYAVPAYGNGWFRLKLAALFVAGVNALVYHARTSAWVEHAAPDESLPLSAHVAGIVSMLSWAVVILAGRMLSYTMF